jgi:NADP-dependent alcohol dehydrogenase
MFETKKQNWHNTEKRIFNLEGAEDEIANEAINKTVEFFHKMGMDTNFRTIQKNTMLLQISL